MFMDISNSVCYWCLLAGHSCCSAACSQIKFTGSTVLRSVHASTSFASTIWHIMVSFHYHFQYVVIFFSLSLSIHIHPLNPSVPIQALFDSALGDDSNALAHPKLHRMHLEHCWCDDPRSDPVTLAPGGSLGYLRASEWKCGIIY